MAFTQFGAAVVVDYPREHGVLREVVAAAVRQVVEVQEVLVVGEVPALPLQCVALGRALRDVVLWGGQGPQVAIELGERWLSGTECVETRRFF